YLHVVGHCYRCRSEIEPWLSGKQWFVAVSRLTGPARRAAEDGRMRFYPERWRRNYTEWLDNLRDWNISRQLWWGHRIPVWYCPDGHEFAAALDPEACPECGQTDLEQDPDVLDTWFSSQLWPFSTLGWPDETEDLAYFYPTTALVTGYEILYLWVARMVMSGMHLVAPQATRTGDPVPFADVVIHGLVRDHVGRKMSKSLGNVIDPLDMIERYGADGLRFALMRMAGPEQQNLPLAEEAIEAGRHFANKIWNAARLVLSAHPGGAPELPPAERWTLAERWLLSRHETARADADRAYEEYRPADAAQSLHRFLWSEYCDWGLELEKARLNGSPDERADSSAVLAWVLERTLRLLHPLMPFVTEEIWQRFDVGESIVVAPWPEPHEPHADPKVEDRFGSLQGLVSEVRGLLAVLPPGTRARALVDRSRRAVVEPLREDVERLTGAGLGFAELDGATSRLELPPDLDVGPIVARKRKKLAEVREQLERRDRKLANPGFLGKAAPEVVDRERSAADALREEESALVAELEQLGRTAS
ncbi:MAG: class I tRNA ligase family protein, partial [Actinobacteria bacterium]|nr:class I tRNA ligase family protein [Actinomycetota bacterium]